MPLGQNLSNRLAVVHFQTLLANEIQTMRFESQQVQDGSMNIGNVMRMFNRMKSKFVGGAVYHAALHSRAAEPHREAIGVMVSPNGFLVAATL